MSIQVNQMFSDISGKYDLLNNIFTFGLHKKWKKKLIDISSSQPRDKIIDIACGTGDLALLFAEEKCDVTALDFSQNMLDVLEKRAQILSANINIIGGDALNIPLEDNSFVLATIGYGIRNVDDPKKCLSEMARLVNKGGKVLILETGQAKGIVGIINKIYSNYIMPTLGNLFAGNYSAYKYLSDTAESFPYGKDFAQMMEETNLFENIEMKKLFFGVSYIYSARVK
jgi:demethylmenaquinone methyltransferase / 2-methoxy-6-polyprenyl-1,4-benzoquinol methylase